MKLRPRELCILTVSSAHSNPYGGAQVTQDYWPIRVFTGRANQKRRRAFPCAFLQDSLSGQAFLNGPGCCALCPAVGFCEACSGKLQSCDMVSTGSGGRADGHGTEQWEVVWWVFPGAEWELATTCGVLATHWTQRQFLNNFPVGVELCRAFGLCMERSFA